MVLPLSYIEPGSLAHVVWIASDPHVKQRLMILGFRPKEALSCIIKPSHGGMGAYLIHNTVFAIRQEKANEIFVEICSCNKEY